MDYGMEMDIDRFNIEDEDTIENPIQDKLDDAVLEIFQQLREKPFRNATQRKEMVSYLTQLLLYDTIEVRRLFREIGKLLNDLADNGLIDGSADSSMEESTRYVPYFEETAKKFGLMKENKPIIMTYKHSYKPIMIDVTLIFEYGNYNEKSVIVYNETSNPNRRNSQVFNNWDDAMLATKTKTSDWIKIK